MNIPESPQKKPYVLQMEEGTYFWCACGRSKNQPFCDSSHKGSSFSPVKTILEKDMNVAWCGCKMSKDFPFCNGSHKSL